MTHSQENSPEVTSFLNTSFLCQTLINVTLYIDLLQCHKHWTN